MRTGSGRTWFAVERLCSPWLVSGVDSCRGGGKKYLGVSDAVDEGRHFGWFWRGIGGQGGSSRGLYDISVEGGSGRG